jgi:hypothetical protein
LAHQGLRDSRIPTGENGAAGECALTFCPACTLWSIFICCVIEKIMNLISCHVCVFTMQQSGFSLVMVGRIYDSIPLKNSLMVVLGQRGSCTFFSSLL